MPTPTSANRCTPDDRFEFNLCEGIAEKLYITQINPRAVYLKSRLQFAGKLQVKWASVLRDGAECFMGGHSSE